MSVLAQLVREPIDVLALSIAGDADGAVCLFVGTVRNHNRGRAVVALEYEAYEEMALPLLREIVNPGRTLRGPRGRTRIRVREQPEANLDRAGTLSFFPPHPVRV